MDIDTKIKNDCGLNRLFFVFVVRRKINIFEVSDENMDNYLRRRILSFKYAFRGVRTLFSETPNALIHLILAVLAVIMGFLFNISQTEWMAIIIVIGLVFAMEAINTAVETLSDYACNKKRHPAIKKVKDLAAAGVLLAAISALIVGIIVFLPKIIALF